MDTSQPPKRAGIVGWSTRRRVWTIVVAIVVVIAGLPVVCAVDSRACAACHYMRPFYDSWRADRHRASASNCLACHLEPGIRGVVTYPFAFYGELLTAVSGGRIDSPGLVFPSDAACQRSGCHSLNRLTSLSGEIAVDHRAHATEAQVPCAKCHPGAGHAGQDGRYMLPPMEACEECHADVMDDCTYCHLGRALPVRPDTP
jgi:hypothetical protein